MDIIEILKIFLYGTFSLLCLATVYLIIEVVRVLCRVRKMMDRLMFITDVREWLQFASFFKKPVKLKK